MLLTSRLQNPSGLYIIRILIVIHTATHATPEDPLICGDGLMNDKAKICNHRKFYNHYYESFFKSSWSGSISVFSPFYSQTPIMLNL